jgi:lysophospholipase L1-like esterase
LRDFGGARGAEVLVVLQPELGQLLPEARVRALAKGPNADFIEGDAYWGHIPALYGKFRKRAYERLEERGVAVVDATDLFRSDAAFPTLFRDPVHLSPRGHAVLATHLRAPVEQLLTRRSTGD